MDHSQLLKSEFDLRTCSCTLWRHPLRPLITRTKVAHTWLVHAYVTGQNNPFDPTIEEKVLRFSPLHTRHWVVPRTFWCLWLDKSSCRSRQWTCLAPRWAVRRNRPPCRSGWWWWSHPGRRLGQPQNASSEPPYIWRKESIIALQLQNTQLTIFQTYSLCWS